MKYPYQSFLLASSIFCLALSAINSELSIAQQTQQLNPLSITGRDELLPALNRPLTDFEINRIEKQLAELNSQAKAELEAGNDEAAWALFYRELRVRRFLGRENEINALSEIAQIAWDKNRNQDLIYLNQRLTEIEAEVTEDNEIEPSFLPLLAQGYDALHSLDRSIGIYQKLLARARAENNMPEATSYLERIGELYLAKFDYSQAEPVYQELLNLARQESDYLQEGIYLQKLAQINGELAKTENAVVYKENLVNHYVANQQIQTLAALKIAIADDYKSLDRPEKASQYYQEAFDLAWSLEQYATAGDALKKLGELYQQYNQNDYALQIYQELIKVEQQSYNLYGLMNTYDAIGKIYLQREEYQKSLFYFNKALQIAYNLKYKIDYFNKNIEEVNLKIKN